MSPANQSPVHVHNFLGESPCEGCDATEHDVLVAKINEAVKILRALIATFPPPDRARPKAVYEAEKFIKAFPEE